MKSLAKKLWVLPVGCLALVWGFSTIGAQSGKPTGGLITAAQIKPMKNINQTADKDGNVTLRGRVCYFKEGEALSITDGNSEVRVEYSDKYKPLRLRLGEPLTVKGELRNARSGQKEIRASEIWAANQRVYPQPFIGTKLRPEGRNSQEMADNAMVPASQATNGKAVSKIGDVMNASKEGETVVIEGVIVDLPEDQALLLKDSSGQIYIEIADAKSALDLKKGDSVRVQGILEMGDEGVFELEAYRIEKN